VGEHGAEDGAADGRPARPRLSDEAQGLAFMQVQGDSVQHLVRTGAQSPAGVGDTQIAHVEEGSGRGASVSVEVLQPDALASAGPSVRTTAS
jgi:hypothetical protein